MPPATRLLRQAWLMPPGLTLGLWLKGFHPGLPLWGCPLRALTGIPCPTCFLTRATVAALHGRWAESVSLHLFGPALALTLLGWSLLAVSRRRLLPPGLPRPSGPARRGLIAGTVLALLAYWLLRLGVTGFPTVAR
jgi:hypothetical protein